MPSQFNIQIKGLDQLIANANRVSGNASRELKQIMIDNTTHISNEAKAIKAGRFKNQTGNLRRSIYRRVYGAEKGLVATDEKYGEYVEFGTRPHVIRPRNKKMLAFKIDGRLVFAKEVRHKGSRPFPFMQPAFEDGKSYAMKNYERYILNVVKGLAK